MREAWLEGLNQVAKKHLLPCHSPYWAATGHLQTIIGNFFFAAPSLPLAQPIRVALPDGDTLAGLYYPGSGSALIYLFHGLCGSTDSHYIREATHWALERGYHVLAINHRGCGTGVGMAALPYHSGRAEDLAEVIRFGRALQPDLVHVGIGFSLSGNAMLLLAADERGHVLPDLAISVNAPIRLEKAAIGLKHGLARIYDMRFWRRCRQAVLLRNRLGFKPVYRLPRFGTLHDFDNYFTAPAAGFAHREDYYQRCSAARFVSRIAIPTIVLMSKDDPMIDYRDYLEASFSEWVYFHLESCGGHLGYLGKGPRRKRRWLTHFLEQMVPPSVDVLRRFREVPS